MNEFHYKCFSDFDMKIECKYDSNSRRYSLEKIKSICIQVTDFDDWEIEEIKRLITSNEKVKVDYYSGFQIIRIGKPNGFVIDSELSKEYMREDLAKADGFRVYWDYESIAIAFSNPTLEKVFRKFLQNASIRKDTDIIEIYL